MDGHIKENAAGNLHIVDGGRFGVTGSDLDDLLLAHLAGSHSFAYSPEIVVEAAVEAYLVFLAAFLDGCQHFFDFLYIVVNGLLAENMLASLQGLDGKGGVLVGGSADEHCFDFRVIQNLMIILGGLLDAQGFCPCFRLFIHEGVSHGFHFCVLHEFGDALPMHMANATCSNDTYFNHVNSAFL